MFGAGAPGQNTLGKHNIEIGLATRQLGSARKIPPRSSIFFAYLKSSVTQDLRLDSANIKPTVS